MQVVVSEMTTVERPPREHRRQPRRADPEGGPPPRRAPQADGPPLLPRLRPPLRDRRAGVPVSTVLRYLRYYEVYGKREAARELYKALPNVSRQLVDADLHAAEAACPHGLPVVDLMKRADRRLA